MKHYIVVKFQKDFDYENRIDDIKSIFNRTLEISGISDVTVMKSNSNRQNRFDLMIQITMENSALELYDNSVPHREWKEKYGGFIDKKAIFDCE